MSATLLALAVLLLLTAQYWLSPIKMRFDHRLEGGSRDLQPVTPEHVMAPSIRRVFDEYGVQLASLGFVATPLIFNGATQKPGYVRVYEHPANGDLATVIAVARPAAAEPHSLVGFTTKLSDGSLVRTGNSPLPSVFPPRRDVRGARFPAERDPSRLYALHRAHAKSYGQRNKPLTVGDPVAYQRSEEEAGRRFWLESGYAYRDGAELRPTWKGAFCMPYRLLWPWKHANERRDEALRRRLLPAAGLA